MEGFLMADTVSKKSNDHFTNQAQLHRTVADHTRQMLSQHQAFHDSLVGEAHSSCMSSVMQNYVNWWESFHPHLQNRIDLHEQMADHLDKSVTGFDETDTNIQQTFTVKNTGFSS